MGALLLVTFVGGSSLAEEPRYALQTGSGDQTGAEATYAEIRSTLGIVPNFLQQYPPGSITAAWNEMKAVQLSATTAIPPKYKELMGLAVASQIPCRFCAIFHTDVAKFHGGSTAEVNEAIAIAASARHWSTYFSGIGYDLGKFKADTDRMITHLKNKTPGAPAQQTSPAVIATAADAYKDMELTLGMVPGFIKKFPAEAVAAAWQDFKSLELNPSTAIPPKYKALFSLAVAAQIPSPETIYFDTQAAKLNGASDQEISETIAMAAVTRRWSTMLNGLNTDETAFRGETAKILAHIGAAKNAPKK